MTELSIDISIELTLEIVKSEVPERKVHVNESLLATRCTAMGCDVDTEACSVEYELSDPPLGCFHAHAARVCTLPSLRQ